MAGVRLSDTTRDYVLHRAAGRIDLAALSRTGPARYPHLLQSVVHGTPQARYDILFAFPRETLRLDADGALRRDGQRLDTHEFLARFDHEWRAQRSAAPAGAAEVPFRGGWFVFLGYDLAREIEPGLPALPPPEGGLPVALATRFPAAVIHDHQGGCTWAMCESAYAPEILPSLLADIKRTRPPVADETVTLAHFEEEDPQRYLDGVARVQGYIREGDVFQVNLSRQWRARLANHVSTAALYRRLCRSNPAPYAALMTLAQDRAVLSSSPERLVKVERGRISTRPIAGTYPRGCDEDEDRALSAALLRHPKERAEHIMLLDLERNDLGRVCIPGTVAVDELMVVESYRHVHHIVSEVSGRLRDGIGPAEVVRAVFPGGTITGCPKVRCMEIISELERVGRGAYTGSLGYVNRDGDMELNILIRTLVKSNRDLWLRAGSGLVHDSVPHRELEETRAKARGLLRAIGIA